jgi:hypothetical protein
MNNTIQNIVDAYIQLSCIGFITRDAFLNICLELDKTICIWELTTYYDYGIATEGLECKIETIFETLKHE